MSSPASTLEKAASPRGRGGCPQSPAGPTEVGTRCSSARLELEGQRVCTSASRTRGFAAEAPEQLGRRLLFPGQGSFPSSAASPVHRPPHSSSLWSAGEGRTKGGFEPGSTLDPVNIDFSLQPLFKAPSKPISTVGSPQGVPDFIFTRGKKGEERVNRLQSKSLSQRK